MEYRSKPLTRFDHYSRHRLLGILLLAFAFVVLLLQLLRLSVADHDRYLAQSRENLFVTKRLSYPRGNIIDRNGEVLATNRKVYSLSFNPYGLKDAEARASLRRVADLTGTITEARIDEIIATRPRWTRHKITNETPLETVLPIIERPRDYPGFRADVRFERDYAFPTDLAHVIGYTSKIQPGEQDDFVRPRYLPDDSVGRAGLERQFEDELAGHPGRERLKRDARGARLDEPEILASSQPGENLFLTLDARLQQRAMTLLRGETGTIILMDAEDGGLLVAASSPTYDASAPDRKELDGAPAGFLNLAIRGRYAPGSTMKIVGAAAALAAGVDPKRQVLCHGSYTLPGWSRPFHCAVRTGHGPETLVESLKHSCNVFYFEIGNELGATPLLEMGRAFGFEEKTGIDLPNEKLGQLSATADPGRGETTNLWIGQGTMLVTPLQVARAYAGLATGHLPTPHVVRAAGHSDQDAHPIDHPRRPLPVPAAHRALITEGLWQVVNETGGTAYKASIPREWDVVGKTGTAETSQGKDDAWFAGFLPRSAPKYVFVIHIESADGHGGEIAGPIARELIGSLLNPSDQSPETVAQLP